MTFKRLKTSGLVLKDFRFAVAPLGQTVLFLHSRLIQTYLIMHLKTIIAGTASILFALTACGPSNEQVAPPSKSSASSASTATKKEEPQKKADDSSVLAAEIGKADPNLYGWRGPLQTGAGVGHYANGKLNPNPLWTRETHGRGTPVIVDGKVFTFGYRGEKEELIEHLACLDEKTGEQLWQIEWRDFISDTVYNRYAIGSPCVDPETKRVYLLSAYGVFICTDFAGKELWRHSLMEEIGRMTFPNSKVGAPIIEGDLVIIQGITSNWGGDGPAANRFYGYDKISGELVWSSTPGEIPPKDSSHSTPVLETRDGKRVFWVGTGCGNIVCVNARTGQPLLRHKMSKGGVNGSVLIHGGNKIIAVHGEENPDTPDKGRMVAIKMPEHFDAQQMVLDPDLSPEKWKANELWRANITAETSSPTLVGDHIYQVTEGGELLSVNANTGAIEWAKKLSNKNIHASPFYEDGLIYCVFPSGQLFVVKPGVSDAEIVQEIKLEGQGIGSPIIAKGHLYVHTTAKFYCFKINHSGIKYDSVPVAVVPQAAAPAALQIIPPEFVIHPGEKHAFKIRSIDKNGFVVADVPKAAWESFIPPTAKVKALLDGKFNDSGEIVAEPSAKQSAGAFKATANGLIGTIRGRVISNLPIEQDFEKFDITEDHPPDTAGETYKFAYPPLPWIGARFKFDVRDLNGNKVLAKSFDRLLFQRAMVFIGTPEMHDYTVQADVMTDGNRRAKSDVGVINQRYMIVLKGNANELEVSSNFERFRRAVPFPVKAQQWYVLKTQVQVNPDGSGVVLAKAWEQGQPEPAEWTIKAETPIVHRLGSPGLFGFTPQNQMRVYIDNIKVKTNK